MFAMRIKFLALLNGYYGQATCGFSMKSVFARYFNNSQILIDRRLVSGFPIGPDVKGGFVAPVREALIDVSDPRVCGRKRFL